MNMSAKSGLFSIIMPAYNVEEFIGEAIESVLAQSYPHWELIIVDDGSTDNTVRVAKRYCDKRIRLIRQSRCGEAEARNVAFNYVLGEYICFLDADDIYSTTHLVVAFDYFRARPEHGAVYTDGYYCDEKGSLLLPLSARRRGPFEGQIFEEVIKASDVFGALGCVVLRADSVPRSVLRFDPEIVIGPDWDFLTRIADHATFGYTNHRSYLYRIHHTNITVRTDARQRSLSLARCRSKAITMPSFNRCSAETRWVVFYDLLVNRLNGFPERQSEILQWPQFLNLPVNMRAKLLRLMASQAIVTGKDNLNIEQWLQESRELDRSDWRTHVVIALYSINPMICSISIRLRRFIRQKPPEVTPFKVMRSRV